MADPGFISGMIGSAIQFVLNEIIAHINIAIHCRKELDALKHLLPRIHSINMEIQEYRKALSSGKIHTSSHHAFPSSAVNSWLNKLNDLLQEASDLAQHCTVPSSYHLISRYQTSRKITHFISVIEEHLNSTPSIAFLHQLHQDVANRQGLQQINEMIDSLQLTTPTLLASTSGDSFPFTSSAPGKIKYIEDPLIIGQDYATTTLEEIVDSAQYKNVCRIGLVGMGGSGKTLLLKRVFNSMSTKVQSLLCNDLMLWVTVSKAPSFNALRNELVKQISLKINERLNSREEEDVKLWLSGRLRENKFALFLDDVWETSANSLLAELCVPLCPQHNSNIIIATSRSSSVLKQLGVPSPAIVQLPKLREDDSWRLFCFHAFPHSDGVLPMSIDEETARRVCNECGGLPLAIKVIGQAMAGVTHSNEWEFALKRLQNAEKYGSVTESLYGRLRLSYDALADFDICLQSCFLYLAAFPEDHVIGARLVSMYWSGEGFVTGHDPLGMGQRYVNLLADRCLIEPLLKDQARGVLLFRVHDVLLDLAQHIAETEETCFFRAGKDLEEFPADDCSAHVRISLMNNRFTIVPNTFGSSHLRCWLMRNNLRLKQIPQQVMRRLISLRVLDLSSTALQSLPKSVGCLKHLVCLRLVSTPIKRLPKSISALTNLQILHLGNSHITKLPSSISKLNSLKLLNISHCKHLQSLPYGISQIKSIEYLSAVGSPHAWIKKGQRKFKRELLSINDLGSLKQLKRLMLENNGEIILEGMFGNMKQMEFLDLNLTEMESLPHDMIFMLKLKKLWLRCPQLLQIEDSFCVFQHLNKISLFECGMLKEVPALHKLESIKHIEIVGCPNIEKLPKEFGKRGAFPKLEEFSLLWLEKLEELPVVEEGALSSLQRLTVMKCEALEVLPKSYWSLKSVEKIRVFGCTMVLNKIKENFIETKTRVKTVTVSATDAEALEKRFHEMVERDEVLTYGEFWGNELFHFLHGIYLVFDSYNIK